MGVSYIVGDGQVRFKRTEPAGISVISKIYTKYSHKASVLPPICMYGFLLGRVRNTPLIRIALVTLGVDVARSTSAYMVCSYLHLA